MPRGVATHPYDVYLHLTQSVQMDATIVSDKIGHIAFCEEFLYR